MTEPDIPLDTPPAEFRRLLEITADRLVAFLESLEAQELRSPRSFDPDASRWLSKPVPEEPSAPSALLDFLFDEIVPHGLNPASPGYLAYIPGGGLPSAAIAELVAGIVNRYTGLWVAAPAAVALEMQAIRWLAKMLRLPESTRGVVTSGGSMSNLLALVAARDRGLRPEEVHRAVVYASEEAHHSFAKAARVAGIPHENIREVAVDAQRRMVPQDLIEQVRRDREAGRIPFFVCATAGTINFGVVDPLDEVGRISSEEALWYHIDGAYGGAFAMLPELATTFRGFSKADSIALDPHKGLFLPYGTGLLLMHRIDDLWETFHSFASYLPSLQLNQQERPDFCELTPELSRDWRGLRLWLPLKLHGARAFREALAEKRALALCAHDAFVKLGVEIAVPPDLSLFAFRVPFSGIDSHEVDSRNEELLRTINDSGRVLLTGTKIDRRLWIRFCVLHLRTHAPRLDEVIGIVTDAVTAIRSRYGAD